MSSSTKTLWVYDDSPVFGGHEVMACHGVDALARVPDLRLVCLCPHENTALLKRWTELRNHFPDRVDIRLLPFHSRKFQGVRSRLEAGNRNWLKEKMREDGASALLALAGDLELCSLGLLAAREAGVCAISYIPVPHTLSEMGAKLASLRDAMNRYLVQVPDAWITISHEMERLLRLRGVEKPVEVVFNGFDPGKTTPAPREEARKRLGLEGCAHWIGLVGRTEFKQKRQDFMLRVFQSDPRRLPDTGLVFVGSGPDLPALREMADRQDLKDRVKILEWTDGLNDVYGAIDLLVIPSRFEGVPLVMLEAMASGVPVVASARDGMKEFLPAEWLFPPGDAEMFLERLQVVLSQRPDSWIEKCRSRVLKDCQLETFQTRFVAAVKQLAWNAPNLSEVAL